MVRHAPSLVGRDLVRDPVESLVDLQCVDADNLGGLPAGHERLGELDRQQRLADARRADHRQHAPRHHEARAKRQEQG